MLLTISGSTITLTRGDGSTDTVTTPNTQYTAGSGITLTGAAFSNAAPDQTVAITGGSNITVSGTYPNFTVTGASATVHDTPTDGATTAAISSNWAQIMLKLLYLLVLYLQILKEVTKRFVI